MLLRHTSPEVVERKGLTVNPAKTCQPVGAMYAALGIHGCLPHSHGSQGCCSYHRSALTRHYKEPVMAATSSFTEGASVFGGQANLLQAIDNIFTIYEPEIIAVHSTCLSETIGDDLKQIISKANEDGKIPAGKHVIYAHTPSYTGSHVTGFANMCHGMVDYFAESTGAKGTHVNILPGWVEPSDMREMRRLATEMGVEAVIAPDTSDVLDAPMTGTHEMYPKGGTTIPELKSMGDAAYTLALGPWASESAATLLNSKCDVPFAVMDLPIGLRATDRFIDKLHKVTGKPVPASITADRGRLLDMMTDMYQYLHGKTVALWGDPDQLLPLAEFLLDLNMVPKYIVTGTPGKKFTKRLETMSPATEARCGSCADMFLMHQWIKNESVDLLMGNTYGKYISRDEDIPLIRMGFPILDRVGHQYFPLVGYQGALRLVEKLLSAILDRKDRDSTEEAFELVM
jgi:nitrogenase molybdenum-iron protein beta chain